MQAEPRRLAGMVCTGEDECLLTVRPAVPMASSIPTLAAGSMTLGSLVMPGSATDNTTHVLISACTQLSLEVYCLGLTAHHIFETKLSKRQYACVNTYASYE